MRKATALAAGIVGVSVSAPVGSDPLTLLKIDSSGWVIRAVETERQLTVRFQYRGSCRKSSESLLRYRPPMSSPRASRPLGVGEAYRTRSNRRKRQNTLFTFGRSED